MSILRAGFGLFVLILATGCASTSTPMASDEAMSSGEAVTASTEGGETQVVCRREQVTGSNFPRRVCRNVSVTAEGREDVREVQREMQRRRTSSFDPVFNSGPNP